MEQQNIRREDATNRSGHAVMLYIDREQGRYEVWADLGPFTHILKLKNEEEAETLYNALLPVEYGSFE